MSGHTHDAPSADDDGIDRDAFTRFLAAPTYAEVDHYGPQSERVHALRLAITDALSDVLFAVHDARAIGDGQQWTIPVGLSCGFEGELVIRIRSAGPDHGPRETPTLPPLSF